MNTAAACLDLQTPAVYATCNLLNELDAGLTQIKRDLQGNTQILRNGEETLNNQMNTPRE